jgi:hypothetical protein
VDSFQDSSGPRVTPFRLHAVAKFIASHAGRVTALTSVAVIWAARTCCALS